MSDSEKYHLQWKGQSYGPWDLPAIRQALATGSIHSLYQIHAGGKWQPLRDFLENLPREVPAIRQAVEAPPQPAAAAVKPVHELAPVRQPGQPPPLPAHLPPPHLGVPIGAPVGAPPLPLFQANPFPHPPHHARESRTSGLAIASFVLSLCFLIPYVNLFSSLLSLVFGHIALGQISRDPSLRGRGLAQAGLIVTYAMIALVITMTVVVVLLSKK